MPGARAGVIHLRSICEPSAIAAPPAVGGLGQLRIQRAFFRFHENAKNDCTAIAMIALRYQPAVAFFGFRYKRTKAAPWPQRESRRSPGVWRLLTALMYLSLVLTPGAAQAQAIAAEFGYGQDVRVQSLDLDFDWCRTCRLAAPEHTSLAWEFAAEAMQGHRPHEANNNLFALGAMPLLRYGWPARNGTLFVEDGIGVRLLSRTRLYNERELSTAFQFGELLGVGLRFCHRNACEAGLRVQHMSNANIKTPNDGVTFPAIRFALHWN